MGQRTECKSTPLLSRFSRVGSLCFFIRHEEMLTLDGRYLFPGFAVVREGWLALEGCRAAFLMTVRKSDLRKVAFVMLCQLLIISALRTLPGMSVSVNASLVESGISLSSCSASPVIRMDFH
ncbi:hypothetical protein Tco_0525198 [Tanacetum coccineum]